MKINILTLFPEMYKGFLGESIIKRGIEKELLEVSLINIRDFAFDKHKMVDDTPFGGGGGMLLKPEPLFRALRSIEKRGLTIYTSPQGKTLNQNIVRKLAKEAEITIIAGHYEGIDERVIEEFVDMEISIGDYVLTGGELPSMVMIDSISRMIPNVLGNEDSFINDSFYNGLLDCPHYTRPAEFEGKKVPEVLLSGHHKNIEIWRKKESLKRTYLRRPDLFESKKLEKQEEKIFNEMLKELKNEK